MPRRNANTFKRGMRRGPKIPKAKRRRLARATLTPMDVHAWKRPGGNRGRA